MASKSARAAGWLLLCVGVVAAAWWMNGEYAEKAEQTAAVNVDESAPATPAPATALRDETQRAASGEVEEDDARITATDEAAHAEDDPGARRRDSLDDAPGYVVARVLSDAIERARIERDVMIEETIVDRIVETGAARVIVAQPPTQPALEPHLVGTRHEPAHYYHYIPFAALSVGPQAMLQLVESNQVLGMQEDALNYPTLAQTIPLIGADVTQAAGQDGTGTVIAILDTGVETTHPVFAGRIADEACFSLQADCPGSVTEAFGPGAGAPCTFNCDHGTTVAGIALGLDTVSGRTGVAPDAGLISIQVFSDDAGDPAAYDSDIIRGLEHVFALRFFHTIAAVNMSLGSGGRNSTVACDAANPATKAAIDMLRGIGIPTVISSGNDGFTDLIGEPACISTAVSVGSTTKADGVSNFSNSATFLSLLAPGESVDTAAVGGAFGVTSGTSMAAPHVAGAWAAAAEVVPGKNVLEVLTAFQNTGTIVVDPRNAIAKPRIDVAAAIGALPGISLVDGFDPESAEGPQYVPPPSLPTGVCGLVGLEALLAVAAARWLRRRSAR